MMDLQTQFGQIDIYLFDQLLRGRIAPGSRVLDAGCGGGRNLAYLLRAGFDVYAADADPHAIASVRQLAATLAPSLPPDHFREEAVEQMSFDAGLVETVISSAVLHFARDDDQFHAMVRSMWRVLKPGGMLFARLASNIGMEDRVRSIRGRRSLLPDGSERYLVDAALLTDLTRTLGGRMLDPIKTTVVHDQRSMTTWVVAKSQTLNG